jgi:uncharacterized protein with HEPN domain
MLFHINAAERFAHGQTFESLRDDLMRLYAIIRSLEIISEASRRVSDELKARYPAFRGEKWLQPAPSIATTTKT